MKDKGIFLAWLAITIFLVLAPVALIINLFIAKDFNAYNYKLAVLIDKLGNVLLSPILNRWFITKDGHKYGDEKETLSTATGMNQRSDTLTKMGILFRKTIDLFFGKNHCIDSITKS